MQQWLVMRDGLQKILRFGDGEIGVAEVRAEAEKLLQLSLIGAVTQLEPELKTLAHWRKWRREHEG